MEYARKLDVGKFLVAILEDKVEQLIGEGAVKQLRGHFLEEDELQREIAAAATRAEQRWTEEYPDHDVVTAVKTMPLHDLPSVRAALRSMCDHPEDPITARALRGKMKEILPPGFTVARVNRAVAAYLEILRIELASIPTLRDTLNVFANLTTARNSERSVELLQGILVAFETLTPSKGPDMGAIREFVTKYRGQVATRHGFIIPPHFDTSRKVPIQQLYVSARILCPPSKSGEGRKVLKEADFLARMDRTILLGSPGSGKSTFAGKVCHNLASAASGGLAGRQVTPILVVLRDYAVAKQGHHMSILDFMTAKAKSDYQVEPPAGACEFLLQTGRATVIFDGLDELLDTRHRQEITADVEAFCHLYPLVPVLVTSREVGYSQSPLNPDVFETYWLAPFGDNQVGEYVTKWFGTDQELTPDQQDQKAQGFLRESRIASDLRCNPLMLSLMCNIYRGENYIPRNRPELYEKCATMLFERWDKSRGIWMPLPFEAHINPAIRYLAYGIYSDQQLQSGVSEHQLIASAKEYLVDRRYEDPEEAEHAAREFVDFCTGRAWVFSDTGTTKDGEKLFQFTHRTFLEYFAAAHLARICPTPDDLCTLLLPKIAAGEWDVVAQLALQIQNRNVEGAADRFLNRLLDHAARTTLGDRGNLLSFAVRSLGFVVPRPKTARRIVSTSVEYCIAWGFDRTRLASRSPSGGRRLDVIFRRVTGRGWSGGSPGEVLAALGEASSENRSAILASLEETVGQNISAEDPDRMLMALEVASGAYYWPHGTFDFSVDRRGELDAIESRLLVDARSKILKLCPTSSAICRLIWPRYDISIAEVVRWHGPASLFRGHEYVLFPGAQRWSIAESAVTQMYETARVAKNAGLHQQLEQIGQILLACPLPWVSVIGTESELWFGRLANHWIWTQGRRAGSPWSVDTGALFGAFCVLAAVLEATSRSRDSHLDMQSAIPALEPLLGARFRLCDEIGVQSCMVECGFSPEQQMLVWRWIRREIDLVAFAEDSRGET